MPSPALRRLAATAAVALSTFTSGSAQRSETSSWSTLPLPPNSAVSSIGTSALVQTPNEVIFYSGILRQWVAQPLVGLPNISLFNAFAIVVDGSTVYGWSSRRGVVEPLTPSPGFQVISGPTTSGWLAMVIDGTTVYGFSAFQGRWVAQTLAAPPVGSAATALAGVVHDGQQAYGFSAYTGTWAAIPDPNPAPSLQVDGVIATVASPGVLHAYSAQKHGWASTPRSATAQLDLQSGVAMLQDGQDFAAFCGYRGNFTTYTATTTTARATLYREFALIEDGTTIAGCAGTRGTWELLPIPMPFAVIDADSEVAIVSSAAAGITVGFSGATGRFSVPIAGTFTTRTDESIGFCESASEAYAYSPILDRFVRLPIAPSAIQGVDLIRSSVLVRTVGSYFAISGRMDRWTQLVSDGLVIGPRGGNGSTALVVETDRAHAWDARLGRFTTTTIGQSPQFSVFRVVGMAIDADGIGYGFGQYTGEWETVRIQGANPRVRASSSIGLVTTTTHVHVYSAHGTLSNPSRFPEFSRFVDRGGELRLIQAGTPRSAVNTLFGTAPTHRPTLFGTLYVDLAAPNVALFSGLIPSDGRLDLSLSIPDDPALTGTQLHIQNFIVPPSGRAYLTNSTSPVIL